MNEQLEDLTPAQLARIEEVKRAKDQRDIGIDIYGRAIAAAHEAGVSYGVLEREIGVKRESIWRSERRYRKRAAGSFDTSAKG